jgi:hypothetical protein
MEKNELFVSSYALSSADGRHHRINIHSKFGGKLVSDSGEAIFCSTEILYRINLDRALHPNGHLTLPYQEGDSRQSSG